MPTPPVRPRNVTSACLFVGISCTLLLYFVIGWLTSWNSLEVQDGLRGALADVDLAAIGISTQGTIDALRTTLLISVVPLVAGIVFSIYAARGHRQSRALLTVIAALAALAFVLTGGLVGLLPAAFAVAAIVQLWSRESRVWFDVVNGREPSVALPAAPVPTPSRPDPFAAGAAAPQVVQQPVAPAAPHEPDRMPSSVRTIVIITSIATGLAMAAGALYLLIHLLAYDAVLQAQLDSPFRSMIEGGEDEIVRAMRVTAVISGIAVALGAAALLAMMLLVKRKAFGHVALTVLAGVTIIVGVFTLVGVPWAAAAIWVLVLLRRRESRSWARLS